MQLQGLAAWPHMPAFTSTCQQAPSDMIESNQTTLHTGKQLVSSPSPSHQLATLHSQLDGADVATTTSSGVHPELAVIHHVQGNLLGLNLCAVHSILTVQKLHDVARCIAHRAVVPATASGRSESCLQGGSGAYLLARVQRVREVSLSQANTTPHCLAFRVDAAWIW